MKLSVSNIAWDDLQDEEMYQYLKDRNFEGLEIAPTRLVMNEPYDHIDEAVRMVRNIKENYNLEISSMQSIWFGRTERIFGTSEERDCLLSYTEKAIRYAAAISCHNIVFGCPKNRNRTQNDNCDIAVDFFERLGKYAVEHGVVIALEPNPTIYNTNFINTTKEAADFVKRIDSRVVKINLDLGTVIYNNESLDVVSEDIDLIHHIHISEPYLNKIENRDLHRQIRDILAEKNYEGYVSIEMKKDENLETVKKAIDYVSEVMR